MIDALDYTLIHDSKAMVSAIKDLSAFPSLAIDLEMENYCHRPGLYLSLIQISTSDKRNFIFDCQSEMNLEPLGALLTNPDIELIIHDASFDKRACYQLYHWKLNHFFDTRIAAQFCGIRQFGLVNLLENLLNIHTNKKFQRFNWLKRPLPNDALQYAVKETAFLFNLKDNLKKRLIELDRLGWVQEEFVLQENIKIPANPVPLHYRIKKSSFLSPAQLTVLRELVAFREELAQKVGQPVQHIIKNKQLLWLAAHPPHNIKELAQINGFHPAVYCKPNMQNFMKAIRKGLQAPEDTHPAWYKKATAKSFNNKLKKKMQKWRAKLACELNLEPHLLLPNDVLKWYASNPDKVPPASIVSCLRKWQKSLLWNSFKKEFAIPEK